MSNDIDAQWPQWPEGEEGRVLLDLALDLQVDAAFLLLQGGLNELSVSAGLPPRVPTARAAPEAHTARLHVRQPNCHFLLLPLGLVQKLFNEAASNKDYSTTAWTEGAAAVQAASVGPTPPPLQDVAGLKAGMLRRASYSGTMMGSKVGRQRDQHPARGC